MEDRHVLYLEIDHKTEIDTLLVDEDSNEWSQGNMKFQSLVTCSIFKHYISTCISQAVMAQEIAN